jgi:hypothetical protein
MFVRPDNSQISVQGNDIKILVTAAPQNGINKQH